MYNPIVAINYIEDMIEKNHSFSYFLYIRAIYSNEYNRFLIHKKYLIFYEIQKKENLIIIKRIIHANVNKSAFY